MEIDTVGWCVDPNTVMTDNNSPLQSPNTSRLNILAFYHICFGVLIHINVYAPVLFTNDVTDGVL